MSHFPLQLRTSASLDFASQRKMHFMPEPSDVNDDRAALDLLVRGFQVSRMLRLVADFGVADRIPPDGNVAIDALAAECGVQSQPLIRVLRRSRLLMSSV